MVYAIESKIIQFNEIEQFRKDSPVALSDDDSAYCGIFKVDQVFKSPRGMYHALYTSKDLGYCFQQMLEEEWKQVNRAERL